METANKAIIEFLKNKEFVWGGVLEDEIRANYGYKASNISRRARELTNAGILEGEMKSLEEGGRKFVKYRFKGEPEQRRLL